MSKMIFFDLEARNKMKKGVDTLANAVKVTLGPKGRNVVIEKKFGSPSITSVVQDNLLSTHSNFDVNISKGDFINSKLYFSNVFKLREKKICKLINNFSFILDFLHQIK